MSFGKKKHDSKAFTNISVILSRIVNTCNFNINHNRA